MAIAWNYPPLAPGLENCLPDACTIATRLTGLYDFREALFLCLSNCGFIRELLAIIARAVFNDTAKVTTQ